MAGKNTKKWILMVAYEVVMDELTTMSNVEVVPRYPEWEQHSYYATKELANRAAEVLFANAKIFATWVMEA